MVFCARVLRFIRDKEEEEEEEEGRGGGTHGRRPHVVIVVGVRFTGVYVCVCV